jgi:hypothetical protein
LGDIITETDATANMIVKFCMLLIIGIFIISAIYTTASSSTDSTNDVSLYFGVISNDNYIPQDGDTITLDNHVFEFANPEDSGVTAGHIRVNIDDTCVYNTTENFITAATPYYEVVEQ